MILRLLTTGSRDWTDVHVLKHVLDGLEADAVEAGAHQLIVVHGAHRPRRDPASGKIPARSADWLVHLWVTTLEHALTVIEEPHPARWSRPCDPGGYPPCPPTPHRRAHQGSQGTYCPLAGHRRNEEMVAAGFDHAVAFNRNNSAGTRDCMDRIIKAAGPDSLTHVEQTSRGR